MTLPSPVMLVQAIFRCQERLREAVDEVVGGGLGLFKRGGLVQPNHLPVLQEDAAVHHG